MFSIFYEVYNYFLYSSVAASNSVETILYLTELDGVLYETIMQSIYGLHDTAAALGTIHPYFLLHLFDPSSVISERSDFTQ